MVHGTQFLKTLYVATTPNWMRTYVWATERVLSDPLLYIVLGGVLLLEWRMPASERQRPLSAGFRQDLCWFLLDRIVWFGVLAVIGQGVRLFYARYLHFLTLDVVLHLPRAARIAFAILLFDFLDWGRHYIKHKVWWLWVFHAVHHSQREMNLFTDFRVHVIESLINTILIFIPLSMFQVGMPADFYIVVIVEWYRVVYHANIKTNYGVLRHILVTPQFHRIHHSSERRHADMNFGVIFTFWDRLFGTHWDNFDEYPVTGVDDEAFPVEQSATGGVATVWAKQMAYPLLTLYRRGSAALTAAVQQRRRDEALY